MGTPGEWRLDSCVRAVYNVSFDRGGRLYSRGANGYQGLRKSERQRVTVDGEETIELDYSGFQPRVSITFKTLIRRETYISLTSFLPPRITPPSSMTTAG